MKVTGLGWVGTRTDEFEATARFFKEVMGLPLAKEARDLAKFTLPDGSDVEVFGPSDEDHTFFTGPVIGFAVDSVSSARTALEAAGVELIGPIQSEGGMSWTHFRGPDGNIYEVTGPA